MPMRDGTGPRGMGANTGRGMGYCDGPRGVEGRMGGYGRGSRRGYCMRPRRAYDRGFDRGPGRGNLWVEEISDRDFLEREKEAMKARLEEIEDMLEQDED